MEYENKQQAMTIYISKLWLDKHKILTIIETYQQKSDVDCSIYENKSFTNGHFEDWLKIEFFNIHPQVLFDMYVAWRSCTGINCAVLDAPSMDYFGCIIESPLNDIENLKCSNK